MAALLEVVERLGVEPRDREEGDRGGEEGDVFHDDDRGASGVPTTATAARARVDRRRCRVQGGAPIEVAS
jgi:hypothetical protein